MEIQLNYNTKEYTLKRYPETEDQSLRAWSSAELLMLDYVNDLSNQDIHLYNDRFGFFNCLLADKNVNTVSTYASQEKSILKNLENNNLPTNIHFSSALEELKKVDLALIKIPKSIALFELFLIQIHKASTERTQVVCGFMTKYFSPAYLKVAQKYFEDIEQSKAWKKSRLLILKAPKNNIEYSSLTNSVKYKEKLYEQYLGVFSADKIDIGTQFLLESVQINSTEGCILDLASGNGVIAGELVDSFVDTTVTLVDDFNLAIESSKMNLKGCKANFVCDDTLDSFKEKSFDAVFSNPPFHFEFENNIEVSLSLFKEVKRVIKDGGRFVLVANKHLNYKTHLSKIFEDVYVLSENKKFVIYECQ